MDAEIKELYDQMQKDKDLDQQRMQDIIKEEISKREKIVFTDLSEDLKSRIMEKVPSTGSGKPATIPVIKAGVPQTESDIPKGKNFFDVVDDLFVHNNVYLYGRAGTGKTVLAQQVAEELCRKNGMYKLGDGDPYYTLSCSQWTSPLQIIGGFSIDGYTAGQLELAWKNGGVFIIDELPKLDPNTAGLLNDALAKSADEKWIPKVDKDGKPEFDAKGEKVMVKKPVYIVNGKGEKIAKHKDFMVIGTGNTDMKSVSVNFSGNNRQDYSLVDRFVGSMYKVDYDYALEYSLCYTAILNIGAGLRNSSVLAAEGTVEAITLRSMLNFNRIYQNQMLKISESPNATWSFGVTDEDIEGGDARIGKTLKDSVMSFVISLGEARANTVKRDARFKSLKNPTNMVTLEEILKEASEDTIGFSRQYGLFSGMDVKGKRLPDAAFLDLKKKRDTKMAELRKDQDKTI